MHTEFPPSAPAEVCVTYRFPQHDDRIYDDGKIRIRVGKIEIIEDADGEIAAWYTGNFEKDAGDWSRSFVTRKADDGFHPLWAQQMVGAGIQRITAEARLVASL